MIEINDRYIVAEVTDVVRRYNLALDAGDAEALNGFFWASPNTVRFGVAENLFGYEEIASFRSGGWKARTPRRLERLAVTTLGRDMATTNAVFRSADGKSVTRQSQTWARFAEGWRIVAAHVSAMSDI